jgi:hypothetical protein
MVIPKVPHIIIHYSNHCFGEMVRNVSRYSTCASPTQCFVSLTCCGICLNSTLSLSCVDDIDDEISSFARGGMELNRVASVWMFCQGSKDILLLSESIFNRVL